MYHNFLLCLALIHFHNNDVAEMAAQDMNGMDFKGISIKTKRQKNVLDNNESISGGQEPKSKRKDTQQQKSDLIDSDKAITDCYYFILNGVCKPKQGQVKFIDLCKPRLTFSNFEM